MELHETLLPGVGLRYEFTNAEGYRIGILALRAGEFLVAVYDDRDPDPDQPVAQYRLSSEEADAVAQVLGAPRLAERFADLTREVPGLVAGQITVGPGSPYDGRTLGDTRARTRTGVSIVAVVRDEDVAASPGPLHPLEAGDTLVVIGTPEGIEKLEQIVAG